MALEQRHKTDEVARKDTKMGGNCDSDGEKCKYNSKNTTLDMASSSMRETKGEEREGVKIRLDYMGPPSSFSSAGAA